MTSALIDLARCEIDYSPWPNTARIYTGPRGKRRPKICFDEWNIWDAERAPGDKGAEEQYTLSDALAMGTWLNIFIRNCKELGMATIAQSVNVISPLMTSSTGLFKQTTYWPLLLFSKFMRGQAIAVHVQCAAYKGETRPEWIQSTCTIPKLDVSAATDGEWVNLAVVNVDENSNFETELTVLGSQSEVEVFIVGGESHQLTDFNSQGKEVVKIQETVWRPEGSTKFTFQKHSFTLLRWKM